jgi:hypothetical protein
MVNLKKLIMNLPNPEAKKKYTFPKNHCGLPQNFFISMVNGKRGMGKSYSTLSMISPLKGSNLYDYYDVYICVSPTRESDDKQKKTFEMIEKDDNKRVYYFDSLTKHNFREVLDIIKEHLEEFNKYRKIKKYLEQLQNAEKGSYTEEELIQMTPFLEEIYETLENIPSYCKHEYPPRTLLYLDDCYGSTDNLLIKYNNNDFLNFLIKHRHNYTSIIMNVQHIGHISKAIRVNVTNWLIFFTNDKNNLKGLYEEVSGAFNSYSEFIECMELLKQDKHQFIYLDLADNTKTDRRIGFDKQII